MKNTTLSGNWSYKPQTPVDAVESKKGSYKTLGNKGNWAQKWWEVVAPDIKPGRQPQRKGRRCLMMSEKEACAGEVLHESTHIVHVNLARNTTMACEPHIIGLWSPNLQQGWLAVDAPPWAISVNAPLKWVFQKHSSHTLLCTKKKMAWILPSYCLFAKMPLVR